MQLASVVAASHSERINLMSDHSNGRKTDDFQRKEAEHSKAWLFDGEEPRRRVCVEVTYVSANTAVASCFPLRSSASQC